MILTIGNLKSDTSKAIPTPSPPQPVLPNNIWQQLFLTLPGTFFELIGQPPTTAQNYTFFSSIEVKDVLVQVNNVFLPNPGLPNLPIHFVGIHPPNDSGFYNGFFLECLIYMNEMQPDSTWQSTVLLASSQIGSENLGWCSDFMARGYLQRIDLDEREETDTDSVGLKTVQLMLAPEAQVDQRVGQLMKQAQATMSEPSQQRAFIELLKTLLIGKLPYKGQVEIEEMLKFSNL